MRAELEALPAKGKRQNASKVVIGNNKLVREMFSAFPDADLEKNFVSRYIPYFDLPAGVSRADIKEVFRNDILKNGSALKKLASLLGGNALPTILMLLKEILLDLYDEEDKETFVKHLDKEVTNSLFKAYSTMHTRPVGVEYLQLWLPVWIFLLRTHYDEILESRNEFKSVDFGLVSRHRKEKSIYYSELHSLNLNCGIDLDNAIKTLKSKHPGRYTRHNVSFQFLRNRDGSALIDSTPFYLFSLNGVSFNPLPACILSFIKGRHTSFNNGVTARKPYLGDVLRFCRFLGFKDKDIKNAFRKLTSLDNRLVYMTVDDAENLCKNLFRQRYSEKNIFLSMAGESLISTGSRSLTFFQYHLFSVDDLRVRVEGSMDQEGVDPLNPQTILVAMENVIRGFSVLRQLWEDQIDLVSIKRQDGWASYLYDTKAITAPLTYYYRNRAFVSRVISMQDRDASNLLDKLQNEKIEADALKFNVERLCSG